MFNKERNKFIQTSLPSILQIMCCHSANHKRTNSKLTSEMFIFSPESIGRCDRCISSQLQVSISILHPRNRLLYSRLGSCDVSAAAATLLSRTRCPVSGERTMLIYLPSLGRAYILNESALFQYVLIWLINYFDSLCRR